MRMRAMLAKCGGGSGTVGVMLSLLVAMSGCGSDNEATPGQDVGVLIDAADGSDGPPPDDCARDADCAGGFQCGDNGTCVPIEEEEDCTSDRDCPGGFRCWEGNCASLDPVICTPFASRCDGDLLRTCGRDGTEETSQPCGDDALCRTEGDAAQCVALVCTPNEIGCQSDEEAFLCNEDGTSQTPFPCGALAYCAEGVCVPRACEPGPATCDGDVLVRCEAPGDTREVTACNETDACRDEAFGCTCAAGACTARICAPGAQRCVGNASQTCSQDGLTWQALTNCGEEELCLAGVCLPVLCEPDTVTCAAEVLVTCGADGTSRTEEDCAASGALCVGDGASAACAAPVCTAGSRTCATVGEVVRTCDARGSSLTEVACDPSEFCQGGVCLPQVCEPGSAAVCVAGDVRRCDARGTGYSLVTTCAPGSSLCRDGACQPIVCTPSTQTCVGETVRTCSADGLSATNVDCAATDAFCRLGECVPRVCDPAEGNVCRSGDVQRCNARGSAYSTVEDCGAATCTAGACDSLCGDGVREGTEACDDGEDNGPDAACTATCTVNTAPPRLLSTVPATLTLARDGVGALRVVLARPALSALSLQVSASISNIVDVPATVAVARNASEVEFSVSARNPGTTELVITLGSSTLRVPVEVQAAVAPRTPRVGEVIVHEIMARAKAGSDRAEWFELRNVSAARLDLQGCHLLDTNGEFLITTSLVMEPGETAVMASSADPEVNFGLPVDLSYEGTLVLNNTGEDLGLGCGAVLIDTVLYSAELVSLGVSMQLRPTSGAQTASGNDAMENWCVNASAPVYGFEDSEPKRGTPGALNRCD